MVAISQLVERQGGIYGGCSYGQSNYNGQCENYNNSWSNYGRWILFGAVVLGIFFIFLIFSCITARRRRRGGQVPFRGTGWAYRHHGPVQYTGGPVPQQEQGPNYYNAPPPPQNNNNNNAPPMYSPPKYGQPQSNGYFGGEQQNGVELQQPNSSYQPQRGGDPVYGAPSGPPPEKRGDGIIR
ncbi:hypothetical protein MMC25_003406 [Agyrium rufum]|nr:hypothetical protein [Agyrium rufum]